MFNSIRIQNYRNLKDLNIGRLGRVNLFIGKNNTGKTSFLEAVYLFADQNEIDVIPRIIISRGENRVIDFNGTNPEKTLQIINNLFWGRNEKNNQRIRICAGDEYLNISIKNISTPEEILGGKIPTKYFMIEVERNEFVTPRHILINGPIGELQFYPPVGDGVLNPKNVKFVRSTLTSQTNSNQLAAYLDNISLGDNYDDVIGALRIIEPNIDRVVYLSDVNLNDRFPVARLKNGTRTSLLSMGDGINRILTIILAMVNCENGYLLLDEFENGLHYSVQEQLWEIIFHLSEKLNIQVFVTTHSNDTIKAFESVVNLSEADPRDGLLIKLENLENNIESLIFEPSELKVITEHLIEVRR